MTRFSAGKSGRRHEGGPAHAGAGFSGWAKGPAGGMDGLPERAAEAGRAQAVRCIDGRASLFAG